jgi:hypothetical protein
MASDFTLLRRRQGVNQNVTILRHFRRRRLFGWIGQSDERLVLRPGDHLGGSFDTTTLSISA